MNNSITSTKSLTEALKAINHELIEVRSDCLNSTIIIKTKKNMSREERVDIKGRVTMGIKVIFYSEEDY